jgi:hypothetical protein
MLAQAGQPAATTPIAHPAPVERVVLSAQRLAVTVVAVVAVVTAVRAVWGRYQKILDHRLHGNGVSDPRSLAGGLEQVLV